ncbi:signal peptidase II [Buchnera aphidicola (Formosaphis micheliae)]|uniref:signal peptidase II n=1 Tax=Buchnera aphidicola TaxID=9 RepID=UPI0031B7F294
MNLYNKKILSPKKTYYLVIFFIIILCDYISKKLIIKNLVEYEFKKIIPMLNIIHLHNYGGAFNVLSNRNIWTFLYFIFTNILIILILLYKTYISIKNNNKNYISYLFIISGSFSNLIDRINHGFIIDFIDLYIKNYHFATFNIADVSIITGIILFIKTLI